jgi:hypothetical protein
LNVVLEDSENCETGQYLGQIVIRGNSIIQFEGIDRIDLANAAAAAAAAAIAAGAGAVSSEPSLVAPSTIET